jgi:hypothetical protein
MAEDFPVGLMRMIAGELYSLVGAEIARSMFGKGYTALSIAEKAAVDQATVGYVASNYQMITPEWVQGRQAPQVPVGFQGSGPSAGTGS